MNEFLDFISISLPTMIISVANIFIYGLSQLSSHRVRNKKLPAMRVEDQKVLPQETPFQ